MLIIAWHLVSAGDVSSFSPLVQIPDKLFADAKKLEQWGQKHRYVKLRLGLRYAPRCA